MRAINGKDFCRLLEQKGWELKRINGSHHIYAKTGCIERISVPLSMAINLLKLDYKNT
ncbi:type II toxin-antitoxin system HicA family toxin [Deferribacter abyssi]|uniref:type II toxin-antitoxin system HicA family toxin n=1 Tax=Deferribacter abyssi TaxID=213806 RepID=UPI003C2B8C67